MSSSFSFTSFESSFNGRATGIPLKSELSTNKIILLSSNNLFLRVLLTYARETYGPGEFKIKNNLLSLLLIKTFVGTLFLMASS